MSFLNANIPPIECLVRGNYLRNQEDSFDKYFHCLIFGVSEHPDQHKAGHVIQLDNGNFAIQPNNRIRVFDPSFATKPNEILLQRKINTHIYTVENSPKWVAEDSDSYEYKTEEIK